jgi:flagellin-like protein
LHKDIYNSITNYGISIMTKLHTNNKLTSRRAVAPVIATLLLVAIAVVGGSIIFVFSQGFFSSAQISGSPQIESLEVIGYDASDVIVLTLHDGTFSDGPGTAAAWDQADDTNGLATGERIAVYLQNQSAQDVTLVEVTLAGNPYTYQVGTGALVAAVTPGDDGTFTLVSNGDATTPAVTKTDPIATLAAGEEVSVLLQLSQGMSLGRDAQFKVETGTGSIFVGTILGGQQSG